MHVFQDDILVTFSNQNVNQRILVHVVMHGNISEVKVDIFEQLLESITQVHTAVIKEFVDTNWAPACDLCCCIKETFQTFVERVRQIP